MRFGFKVIMATAAAGLIVGGAFLFQWVAGPAQQTSPAAPTRYDALGVQVLRSEVSSSRTREAIVKIHFRIRNEGAVPLQFGPGSFWLLDATGLPYLDRYAAEQPHAAPWTLEPGAAEREVTVKFQMPPNSMRGRLALLIGPPPTEKVTESGPPLNPKIVPVKDDAPPKGPFLEGKWKTFTSPRWQ